jgi:glycosyltransferase involved in cell wall biosynthesis
MSKLKTPFVTIIMPVRNEGVFISRSLGAVLTQDYCADCMEILVVDGMSTDETRATVADLASADSRIRLIDNQAYIVPHALNNAIFQARGDIIIRIDGHCEIAPNYVSLCVAKLQNSEADAVGGPIETLGETPSAQAIALAMSSWFGMGGSAFRTIHDREIWVETVAFPAYPRATIERIGLFDEEFVRNQDDEYNYRLLKQGGKILLCPQIRSRYYSRASLRKLWPQFYRYGYWKVRVMQKHPRQMRLRQFVPFMFVTTLLFTLLVPQLQPLALVIALLYLLADCIASFKLAHEHDWRYLPTMLLAHPTMHFAYGFGSLAGLVRFARRWRDTDGQIPILNSQRKKTPKVHALPFD